jgi:GTPase SAR1 family protein
MKQKGEGVTVIDLVTLGSKSSGKTSLLHYFLYEKFYEPPDAQATSSIDNGGMEILLVNSLCAEH